MVSTRKWLLQKAWTTQVHLTFPVWINNGYLYQCSEDQILVSCTDTSVSWPIFCLQMRFLFFTSDERTLLICHLMKQMDGKPRSSTDSHCILWNHPSSLWSTNSLKMQDTQCEPNSISSDNIRKQSQPCEQEHQGKIWIWFMLHWKNARGIWKKWQPKKYLSPSFALRCLSQLSILRLNMIKHLIRLKSYVSASQIINFWLLDIFSGSFSLLRKRIKN